MIRTKRIADPPADPDGTRILIARYRPRGVRRGEETWDAWEKRLAPSPPLLDAFHGKRRERGRLVEKGLPPLPWDEYVRRFHAEMEGEAARAAIAELAARSRAGETIALLCYCQDERRCHRSLVRALVEEEAR